MSKSFNYKAFSKRKSFAKVQNIVPIPNLIEVQSNSFNDFVQLDFLQSERLDIGLEKIFKGIFPISYLDKMSLEYVGYELGKWECICGKLAGINQRYSWKCYSCNKVGVSRLNKDKQCSGCKNNSANYVSCQNCLSRVIIKPVLTVEECRSGAQSFSLPLKIKLQLVSWNSSEDIRAKKVVRDVKEQEIFLLDLPVMCDLFESDGVFKLGSIGTFIVNGVERVIVSQMHRSAGVVFAHSKKLKDVSGGSNFIARIIPMRGSWLDFEIDSKDTMYVRIDKNKKILVTTFLQAIGIERSDIVKTFYKFTEYVSLSGKIYIKLDKKCIGMRIEEGMLVKKYEGEFINKKIDEDIYKKLIKLGVIGFQVQKSSVLGKIIGSDIIDASTGEVIASQAEKLNEGLLDYILNVDNLVFSLVSTPTYSVNSIIPFTLTFDKCVSCESAIKEVYAKIFPGEIAPYQNMKERIEAIFFDKKMYDLTRVGRVKINRKLSLNVSEDVCCLTRNDIIETIRYLINLREQNEGSIDDIDHLGNRRVRLVGELLANQFHSGMLRIEKIIRERLRIYDTNKTLAPYDLFNVKPLSATIREFFATGQLSQFMDQTNPLAEIAHKRRLSSLGPGGVTRERATYEIRDVHTSHYGRICPIETPEGQSIGLISSLSTMASVNDLGFIETSYRPVVNGRVTDEIVYLDAFEEDGAYIAQVEMLKDGNTLASDKKILCRHRGGFVYVEREKIQYIDLSSNQIFSVATALIPFLQHDDAVRALMGSNMQRQAVPLIKAEPPIVGTGMESSIAEASGACVFARHDGVVKYVSAEKIVVVVDKDRLNSFDDWIINGIETYNLRVFEGSSWYTCIHQTPIVRIGDRVQKGQILSNSTAIVDAELSLGKNLLVAFVPWYGYNYEDAIVLNKRIVSENVLTSIKIQEYVVDARETRLGPEEITADIPNVSSEALSALDDDGIVKIGTRVKAGDILVGKVSLKGDVQHSPEEKLLRAIFGDKSREVKETSLRVPAGVEGIVIGVDVFSRSGSRSDERYKMNAAIEANKLKKEFDMHRRLLEDMIKKFIVDLIVDKKADVSIESSLKKKDLCREDLLALSFGDILSAKTNDVQLNKKIIESKNAYSMQLKILEQLHKEKISKLRKGDPLASGVLKMVKVYVASIRNVQVGDKISGRHGNKGVVSLILPREDMPYMDDGTPVDVILNPLGVPSRMNIGQILETILGYLGRKIGEKYKDRLNGARSDALKNEISKLYGEQFVREYEKAYGENGLEDLARYMAKNGAYFAVPVFDSGTFDENIKPLLKQEGLSEAGTYKLRDGLTGEYLNQAVTVGVMYVMKLNHMVDDKLHARSVGPYSLVTQQPLGGKSQMGGQRFGEMEVWALEAYGAAYTLQELLTYKSDDVTGRHKVYDAIVRGEKIPSPGIPESFNVLIKELQALGLRVDLFKSDKEGILGVK
jgi:DNA-directed RNA polymerase subunit beta